MGDLNEFDALFISIGFQKGLRLEFRVRILRGFMTALDFLKRVNAGQEVSLGRRVAVIGGGNSAMDAARAHCVWGPSL